MPLTNTVRPNAYAYTSCTVYTLYGILSIGFPRQTIMSDMKETLKERFQALKDCLKKAGIDAIETDQFDRSRRFTEIMEHLAALEAQAMELADGTAAKPVAKTTPETKDKARNGEYPRFYRSGRLLYKEGLKQGGGGTYTQKVDRAAFEAILQAILKQRGKFRPATVLDKLDQPSYQFYIVLNVLQDAGLIDNPERGAYRLTAAAKKVDGEVIWSGLDQRLDSLLSDTFSAWPP